MGRENTFAPPSAGIRAFPLALAVPLCVGQSGRNKYSCHNATCPQRFAERSRSTKRSDRTFQSHGESSTGSGCREDRVVIGLDWCTLKSTNPDDLMDLKSLQE
jgi:hypothetical protein